MNYYKIRFQPERKIVSYYIFKSELNKFQIILFLYDYEIGNYDDYEIEPIRAYGFIDYPTLEEALEHLNIKKKVKMDNSKIEQTLALLTKRLEDTASDLEVVKALLKQQPQKQQEYFKPGDLFLGTVNWGQGIRRPLYILSCGNNTHIQLISIGKNSCRWSDDPITNLEKEAFLKQHPEMTPITDNKEILNIIINEYDMKDIFVKYY